MISLFKTIHSLVGGVRDLTPKEKDAWQKYLKDKLREFQMKNGTQATMRDMGKMKADFMSTLKK